MEDKYLAELIYKSVVEHTHKALGKIAANEIMDYLKKAYPNNIYIQGWTPYKI